MSVTLLINLNNLTIINSLCFFHKFPRTQQFKFLITMLGTGQPRNIRPSSAHSLQRSSSSLRHKNNEYVLVDNYGSTARDHLGQERTFLAWLRTLLALFSVGALLALDGGISRYLGGFMILTAFCGLAMILHRFLISQKRLVLERTVALETNGIAKWIFSAMSVTVALSLIVLIWWDL